MKQKNAFSTYAVIGTMLFGMFFGAGNLIFPIQMGQLAGMNFWPALTGFIVTAIGLPFFRDSSYRIIRQQWFKATG